MRIEIFYYNTVTDIQQLRMLHLARQITTSIHVGQPYELKYYI